MWPSTACGSKPSFPGLLALLANKAKTIVQKHGQLMLEKPSKTKTTTT